MIDFNEIYTHQAGLYQRMVACEDYQNNLLPAIQAISPVNGLDVIETGAGTGRLTALLAPLARAVFAFDLSAHMLQVARPRLHPPGQAPVPLGVANHTHLPVASARADLIISGWSLCYVWLDHPDQPRALLDWTLAGFRRILKPGGKLIVIETLGTGYAQPHRYPFLLAYLDDLDQRGFHLHSIRTDFRFATTDQARQLVPFFFGDEMLAQLDGCLLPECTGLWWIDRAGLPENSHEI